jgi:hypothetical protein
MSRPHDKDVETAPAPADDRPGKVEFDSRGNSVWRWAKDLAGSTSVLLKRLDNKDLALEPTQKVPVMKGAQNAPAGGKQHRRADQSVQPEQAPRHPALQRDDRRSKGGGGFDPYNSR